MSSNKSYWIIAGVLFVALILVWSFLTVEDERVLEVAFLDVGQGDAIYIEAPNGNQALIDAGRSSAVLRELGKVMPFYDRSIDMIIATHPDADHIGGFPEVLERFEVGIVMRSGAQNDTAVFESFENEIREEGAEEILARSGQVIHLDEGVYIKVLFPDRDVARADTNDASIVLQLVYGETEFLFTGDAGKSVERYLVKTYGKSLESDVLKVGHHGSRTSSDENFLKVVDPKYAVISAGEDNRYGHPHKEVTESLSASAIEVFGTYNKNTITLTSDGHAVFLMK